jgi:FkbM family methyltransferase
MLGKILHRLQSSAINNHNIKGDSALAAKPSQSDNYKRVTFSQCGEDAIIDFVARQCGIEINSYFDIGANHPFEYSNTHLFYSRGASGVCVEPIPTMADKFRLARPKDTVLTNVISSVTDPVLFYVLDPSTLSTLDPGALERALQTPGAVLVDKIDVYPTSLNTLFKQHGVPQLLCIDVEGGDMDVLSTWDMTRYRPPLLCVEDLEYTTIRTARRPLGVTDLLLQNGYMLFANTFINSILVDTNTWVEA